MEDRMAGILINTEKDAREAFRRYRLVMQIYIGWKETIGINNMI